MAFQQIPKELILQAIERIGPSQPIDIRKELRQGDSMLIGALLSELVAQQQLAITVTRRGGSPFYYDPKRPESLERISQYLNEKDRRTCAMLKERKLLCEEEQEPLVRVGLQAIADFARKLVVQQDGKEVVWWRYYLMPEEEAKLLIFGKKSPAAPASAAPASGADDSVQQKIGSATPLQTAAPEKKERKKRAPRKKAEPAVAPPSASDWIAHDTLWQRVQAYAQQKQLAAADARILKPNSELTCTFTGDSMYGKLSHHVLALNKKKITEKEITQELLAARGKGMPLLVLSVEEIPAKLLRSVDGLANVYLTRL